MGEQTVTQNVPVQLTHTHPSVSYQTVDKSVPKTVNTIVEQTQVVPLNLTQESVVEVPEVVNVDLTRQRAKTVVQQNAKVVTTQNNVVNNITQEVAQTAIKEQVVAVDRV